MVRAISISAAGSTGHGVAPLAGLPPPRALLPARHRRSSPAAERTCGGAVPVCVRRSRFAMSDSSSAASAASSDSGDDATTAAEEARRQQWCDPLYFMQMLCSMLTPSASRLQVC